MAWRVEGKQTADSAGAVPVARHALPACGVNTGASAGVPNDGREHLMSHFFAYLSRMKFIKRWGLMHNTYPENIQEHSLRVAMIAHALALIRNRVFDGAVHPERTAVLALYHDASEVLTGDLPAPVKSFNPAIKTAYKAIEAAAARPLCQMLPEVLQTDYQSLLMPDEADRVHRELVTAADKLCAYLKCLEERGAGNPEFAKAEKALRASVEALALPEVRYFLDTFVPSFRLTLDELE
jgi:5'-deoxynucleotidase